MAGNVPRASLFVIEGLGRALWRLRHNTVILAIAEASNFPSMSAPHQCGIGRDYVALDIHHVFVLPAVPA